MARHSRREVLRSTLASAAGLAIGGKLLSQSAFADDQKIGASIELGGSRRVPSALELYYTKPASLWTEALPVGNGKLAAMIFGGVGRERIQLNEDTLWAGGPYNPNNPEMLAALPETRELIFAGKYKEASDLITSKILAKPLKQMAYSTVGDLYLDSMSGSPVTGYQRDLDLDSAFSRVTFVQGGAAHLREVFASFPDRVIVMRWRASEAGRISFAASMSSPQDQVKIDVEDGNTLVLRGHNRKSQGVEGALTFQSRVKILADGGAVAAGDGVIRVSGANSVMFLMSTATSYKRFDDVSGDPEAIVKEAIAKASARTFEQLRDAHLADYRDLFRRLTIDLGTTPAANLPTDERIRDSAKSDDPALAALYFQYARYLLISSSRPGSQAANLQGKWNESLNPPWGSKYTININTEMNYWPAETTNLAPCVSPLIEMVRDLSINGAKTAKDSYGARGWVCHHNTDLWRACAPIDGANYGIWPTGGAWLCKHLWDHYEFNPDAKYLADVYPILKGAAEFFVDTLVEEPTHKWLVTCPSISPENKHPGDVAVCAGPTMDEQIIRDLFDNCIKASEILNLDAEFREQLKKTRDRLAPSQVGAQGQLQEWLEDWDAQAKDQHHRHVSHLYGLFPSAQTDPRLTPELAAAAKQSLNNRGDLATGWAIAWRINLWARLLDAERTHSIIKLLLDPSRTYPNMFDAHPPFQIDGNFGGASGIAEMLLQSHNGEIHLLPALPKAWASGSVKGLRARGGVEVDIEWKDQKLVFARLRNRSLATHIVRYGGKIAKMEFEGEAVFDADFLFHPDKPR